jgi:hypothetical protein
MAKLEERAKELATEIARLKTKVSLRTGSVQEEEKRVADLDAASKDVRPLVCVRNV